MWIEEIWRSLNSYADGNAISKTGWKMLDVICEKEIGDNISADLKHKVQMIITEIRNLKCELLTQKDLLLDDGFTLTRQGRKRLRQTCDIISKLPEE